MSQRNLSMIVATPYLRGKFFILITYHLFLVWYVTNTKMSNVLVFLRSFDMSIISFHIRECFLILSFFKISCTFFLQVLCLMSLDFTVWIHWLPDGLADI